MFNKNFIDFSIRLLIKDKKEHFFSFTIFAFIVFLLSSVLFVSDSIKHDLLFSLGLEDQIIATNTKSGKYAPITEAHLDEMLLFDGVEGAKGVVQGYYNFAQNRHFIQIIGDENLEDRQMVISELAK